MLAESLKEEARRHEQREEWIRALELYLQVIDKQSDEDEPDIALHNRVGDLQVRLGDIEGAVTSYERAIELYLAAELPNNAIAVCRKIIRTDVRRPSPFLRMGQIRAAQGFLVDARQSFLTYAEMLQARNQTDEALKALEEFTRLAPEDIEIRVFLADQLASRKRAEEGGEYLVQAYRVLQGRGKPDEARGILDKLRGISPTLAEVAESGASPAAPAPAEPAVTEGTLGLGGLMGFESTSLGFDLDSDSEGEAEAEPTFAESALGGFDFSDISIGGEEESHPKQEEGDEEGEPEEYEPEENAISLPTFDELEDDSTEDATPLPIFSLEGLESSEFDLQEEGDEEGEPEEEAFPLPTFDAFEDDSTEDATPLPLFGDDELLDVEPEVDLAVAPPSIPTDGRGWLAHAEVLLAAGSLEEGLDSLERAHPLLASEGAAHEALATVTRLHAHSRGGLELLRRAVEYAYQTQEAPLLAGAFLTLAASLEEAGDRPRALAVYQQVLSLDPENERARAALAEADRMREAGAVLDPSAGEARAPSASEPEPEPLAAAFPSLTFPPPSPAPRPAAASGVKEGDEEYVDLGALVLDEPTEGTRWVVAAEAPSGDEDADFARMLGQFKQKVAQHLSVDDAKGHYDLGTAYKEMGLVDEAISEFQQALRADPGNLATFEMLGQCFLDRGEPEVAVRILERGISLPSPVEDDLLGIYYFLGQAYELVARVDAAREMYEKVFSLDINFRDVTERLRRMR